ncbi:MAG: archaemetzincin family Zn-dependent metalloprotease [Deltaproteobacteria bacterium]|nr:archaemetzincin family Zn-dependent metalloprotease [Deltaproteobacteria bacterium]
MPSIYIVPAWHIEKYSLEFLKVRIEEVFRKKTIIYEDKKINLEAIYSPSRKQYNSSQFLIQLLNNHPKDAFRILGVTDVDLFIPILTFVFGEAQLNGLAGVVSVHRLNNKFYGLPENEELLRKRLIKEAIHELGHTYGLVHCTTPGCVMNSSTYVEDIDRKSEFFCSSCISFIRR